MKPTPLAVGWGESLRAAREAFPTADGHPLQQIELAEIVGCHSSTISKIEAGIHRPNDELRIALARALDTTVEELFPYPAEKAS